MSFLAPIVSQTFPGPRPGPHKSLGYAFLSTPVISPWSLKSPTFKNGGKPALTLEDIGYAVYYPSSAPRRGWFGSGEGSVDWLASPKKEVVRGYERFLGQRAYWILMQLMKVFASGMKFRANAHLPLLPPPETKRYPLVIFSHGLAGTRTTYSQYCSALASEGYVVLSVEHKDGSGPAVAVPSGQGDGEVDGVLHYIRHPELDFASNEDSSLLHFRTLQLQMRLREIYETYHSFRRVLDKDITPTIHGIEAGASAEWLDSFRDKIDLDRLYLTGHSFGGATVINALQTPPPDPQLDKLPVIKAIALDPWLEPLPTPSPSQYSRGDMPPIFVANSPGFTEWTGHFERLVRLAKGAHGSLVTVMKGNHQSFSDFPLLLPPSSSKLKFLHTTHDLSINFLRGTLSSASSLKGQEPDGGTIELDDKGKLHSGHDVILHLLGKE